MTIPTEPGIKYKYVEGFRCHECGFAFWDGPAWIQSGICPECGNPGPFNNFRPIRLDWIWAPIRWWSPLTWRGGRWVISDQQRGKP